MQKFKKLSSLLLVFALLFNFFLPVNAANTEGVTYTASVDQSTLNVSSEAQTVVMTVRADEKVVLDSLGADVIVPEGWTITAIENEELEFLATDFDCGNAVIAYATADAENKTTDLLAVITFQVPANAAAGTYEVGLRGLNMSRDYGSILWEDGEGPDVKTTVTVKDKAEAPDITYNATVSPETLISSDEAQTVVMTVKASEKVVLDSLGADIIVPEGWTITAIENEELDFLATDFDCGNAVIAYATADAENKTTDLLAVITFQVPANAATGTYEVGLRGLNMSRDYGSILWEDGEGPDITATVTVEEKPAAAEVTYNATVSPETLTSSDEAQTVVMTVKASEKVVLDSLGADIIVPEGWTITAIENEELDFLATDYDCGNAVIAYATADAENKTTDLLAVITFQVPANVAAGTYEVGLRGLNMSRDYGSILWEDGEGPDITATITVKGAPEHICQNNLTAVPAKGATCTEPGNIAYYICSCGKYYEDAAASKEIKAEDVVIPATGHSYTETVTKEPTCTEKGEKTFTCSRCGHSYTEEISAKGHTYDSVVTAPTCTEKGYTTHTCSCGDSYVDSYVDALGHDMGQWETTKEATCTEKGVKERKCSRCDHTETEEIDALGHDYKAVVTAPTCTEKGYTTHTCSRCGDSYVDTYVDALGHTWDAGVVTVEPTEETEGEMLYTCTVCHATRTEVIPALDHEHNYEAVVTAPTCTEKGYTTHTCSCGDSYVDSYVDALGHDMGQWETTKEATCTEKGVKERKCSRCDHTETEESAALGHDHKAVVTAPTCTEKGYTTHTCSRCGDSYVDTYVDALGHDMGQWETTKEATCTEKGVKERKCSRCDHTETEEIAALGHEYTAVVTEPTCEAQGYTTYTCSRCGDSYVSDYTDPVDHVYEDGHCKWCGKGEEYAKFTTISTSLGGNIAMNFYMELSKDLVSDPDAYIQFTFAGRTVKVPLSQGVVSGNTYRFSCPITSKNMTDEITAQVYNENGPVGNSKTMDVATYCNWVIDNYTDAKTVNLMKAMLNYGASAQMLFNYRTDDLANAALSDADKVLGKVDASAYVHSRTGEEEGIKPDNYTLLLDSETTVRVYFKLTGDKTIDEYTFTVDGVEVTPVYKNGLYYIQKTDIGAHRLDELHVFTCGDITITYGGLSYVNQVMTYYESGTTFDMASALFAYSKAAEDYIG